MDTTGGVNRESGDRSEGPKRKRSSEDDTAPRPYYGIILRPSAACAYPNNEDPFQLIGEDVHRLILGYLMCLPPTLPKPKDALKPFLHFVHAERDQVRRANPTEPVSDICRELAEMYKSLEEGQKEEWESVSREDRRREAMERKAYVSSRYKRRMQPFFFYCRANEKRVIDANPDAGYDDLCKILLDEYESLSDEGLGKWIKLSVEDLMGTSREEEMFYDTSRRLLRECVNIAIVSRAWQEVAYKEMNSGAPTGIVTHRRLATLKERVASLDLEGVKFSFYESLRKVVLDIQGGRLNDATVSDITSFGAILIYLDLEYELPHLLNRVIAEYRKFLVVRSVEIEAGRKTDTNSSNGTAILSPSSWTGCSSPCQLVSMFWAVHASSGEKYSDDCKELIGDVIGFNDDRRASGDSCSYRSKARELFCFEDEMTPYIKGSNSFPDNLFDEDFDAKKTAEEMMFNTIAINFDPTQWRGRKESPFQGHYEDEPLLTLIPEDYIWGYEYRCRARR